MDRVPCRLDGRRYDSTRAIGQRAARVARSCGEAGRRRGPRVVPAGSGMTVDQAVPDTRWLSAGEPKAVAARAAQGLRRAVAHAIPEAHEALSTEECLATIEQVRPDAPLRDLRELLQALDQVAFATAHGVEVAPLAAKARALARELNRAGNGAHP